VDFHSIEVGFSLLYDPGLAYINFQQGATFAKYFGGDFANGSANRLN
jgi:hypothetical protein